MKTLRQVLFVAVVSAGTLLVSGCVSEAKYKEALAQNRRVREALQAAQQNEQRLREEKQQFSEELLRRDGLLAARQKEIDLLTEAGGALRKDFDELAARYRELVNRTGQPGPGPLPPVLSQALQDLVKTNPELMEYLPKYGMVKLKADLTFAAGSDTVSPRAIDALVKLVEIMNSPGAKGFNVYIAGHTDDMRIAKPATKRRHPTNWYLSVHRAVSVEEVMEKANLAPGRIAAMGFGEYHPVAPNAPDKKGNVLNRRVEIWIVPPDRLLTAPGAVGTAE